MTSECSIGAGTTAAGIGSLPRPLRGIIPPMVTPLRARDELDIGGLERLVAHILAGGVHGIFVLGTTGEGPGLSYRLRREMIQRTCEEAARRVPVLVGITDSAFTESVALAEAAAEFGAAAVVTAPPFYFPVGQPELLEYLEHLTAQLPLPLLLYNMPSCTKVVFDPETVRAAAAMPGIVGLKDSSGDPAYFRELRAAVSDTPDFALLVGPEEMLREALEMGAHGGVPGGANLCPRLYVGLYDAVCAGDGRAARDLQDRILTLSAGLYRQGRHSSSYLKGLKCALSCLGICDDFMAEPFRRFRDPQRRAIMERLAELGIRPASATPGIRAEESMFADAQVERRMQR